MGLGKRYFRKFEDLGKKVHTARERPPYSVRHGPVDGTREVGQRASSSSLSDRDRKKHQPYLDAPSHTVSPPFFSFGAKVIFNLVSLPSQAAVPGADGRSALGFTSPRVSVSGFKGDGKSGRFDQERMGNFSKGKDHGVVSKHAGSDKSKSHHDLGMVRPRLDESVTTHFSSNARKQKDRVASTLRPGVDGVGSPLVDISIKHFDKGGSAGVWVESALPKSLDQSLKESKQEEKGLVRKTWISKMGVVRCWGNEISKNLIQAEATMVGFNLLITSREIQLGVLEHIVLLTPGVESSRRSLRELGWRFLSKMDARNPYEGALALPQSVPMNIILWNCRGGNKPTFSCFSEESY